MNNLFAVVFVFGALPILAQSSCDLSELHYICSRFENEVHLSEESCEWAMRELDGLEDEIEDEDCRDQKSALRKIESVRLVIAVLDGCQWDVATYADFTAAKEFLDVSLYRVNHGDHCVEVTLATVGSDGYEVFLVYNPSDQWISFDGSYRAQLPGGYSSGNLTCGISGHGYRQFATSREDEAFDQLKLVSAKCTALGY